MEKMVGQSVVGKSELLDISGVYVKYTKGNGDILLWEKEEGYAVEVIDLVGGFGSTLLGHNNPEIIEVVQQCMNSGIPVHVQGSDREYAKSFKVELQHFLKDVTGKDFSIMLLNTGTEAVEAAIKHAEYEYTRRLMRVGDSFSDELRIFKSKYELNIVELDDKFYRRAEKLLNQEPIEDLDSFLLAAAKYNQEAFNTKPYCAAFKGDFHGKTRGALSLTWNRDARIPFIRNVKDAVFVDDVQEFKCLVESRCKDYVALEFSPIRLVKKKINPFAAFIYEPLQGEGGINLLTEERGNLLRFLSNTYPDVAFIADEIQCGLGRTGNSLESTTQNLPNDYIVLAKSIGGGFSKLSAVAIDKKRFRQEFDFLHSSTFSEDPVSSVVGKRTLEIIQRDNISERCKLIGREIYDSLMEVKIAYPDIIADVRGRGCMLGVELNDLTNSKSALLSSLSSNDMLSMIVAGHFLHNHHIRILPSLGNRRVLRIQPSAYFKAELVVKVANAFNSVCKLLRSANSAELINYLVSNEEKEFIENIYHPSRDHNRENSGLKKIGFISHFIDKKSLKEIDPSLEVYDEYELEEFTDRIKPIMEPQVIAKRVVRSKFGKEIEFVLFGIQMDAESIEQDMTFNKSAFIKSQVNDAYFQAREQGCSTVGFGGYTSIVTSNCVDFCHLSPSVTTGNSLTVASSMATVEGSALELGIKLGVACVAVLGATGNIGEVHSRLLAEKCGSLLLIGRPGSSARMMRVAEMICEDLAVLGDDACSGGNLYLEAKKYIDEKENASNPLSGTLRSGLLEHLMASNLLIISEDINDCKKSDIIIAATNSAKPILQKCHIREDKKVLINDIAVPRDVDKSVAEHMDNVKVICGGVVGLPYNPDFSLPGMLLQPGYVYACAAEAILLGLSGIQDNYSLGAIKPFQVKEIAGLAKIHGFELNNAKTVNVF